MQKVNRFSKTLLTDIQLQTFNSHGALKSVSGPIVKDNSYNLVHIKLSVLIFFTKKCEQLLKCYDDAKQVFAFNTFENVMSGSLITSIVFFLFFFPN